MSFNLLVSTVPASSSLLMLFPCFSLWN